MIVAHKIALDPNIAPEIYLSERPGQRGFAYNCALAKCKRQRQGGERPRHHCGASSTTSKTSGSLGCEKSRKNAPQQAIENLGTAFKDCFSDLKKPKHRQRFHDPPFKKEGRRIGILPMPSR
jgi:putative transposase